MIIYEIPIFRQDEKEKKQQFAQKSFRGKSQQQAMFAEAQAGDTMEDPMSEAFLQMAGAFS